jgi:hypothetical protein
VLGKDAIEGSLLAVLYPPGTLAEELDKGNNILFGQVSPGEKTGYIVKQFLAKCLPEDIDKFENTFKKQIIDFMTHYARVLNSYGHIIMADTK